MKYVKSIKGITDIRYILLKFLLFSRLASVQEQRVPPNPVGPNAVPNGDPRSTSPTHNKENHSSSTKVCVITPTPRPSPAVAHSITPKGHPPLSRKRTPTSLWPPLAGWSSFPYLCLSKLTRKVITVWLMSVWYFSSFQIRFSFIVFGDLFNLLRIRWIVVLSI